MKKNIKNNELHGRAKYVPASVEVIEVTAQRIICTSPEATFGIEQDTGYEELDW